MTTTYLRALESTDLDLVHKWHNDMELYEALGGTFHFASKDAESEWLLKKSKFTADQINLAICLKKNSRHIGNIYLRDINWISGTAELHIFIGEKNLRGKGHGTDAINLLLQYAFMELGLRKIYLHVLEDNSVAISTYKKCGFVQEGLLQQHVFKNGHFRNLLIMSIFKKTSDTTNP
jgi:RimJ/RimL family protein N-acetyltransferase